MQRPVLIKLKQFKSSPILNLNGKGLCACARSPQHHPQRRGRCREGRVPDFTHGAVAGVKLLQSHTKTAAEGNSYLTRDCSCAPKSGSLAHSLISNWLCAMGQSEICPPKSHFFSSQKFFLQDGVYENNTRFTKICGPDALLLIGQKSH